MLLELALSIVIAFGAGDISGGFNECPPATQPDVVSAPQDTTTTTTVKQSKKA
jgi:hypothetical protein